MTTSQLENNWNELKGKLKQRYSKLSDDDLLFGEGKGEELLGRLQQKLGISRQELDATLNDLASTAQGSLKQVKTKAAQVSDQFREKTGDVVADLKQRATALGEDARVQSAAAYDEARRRACGLWEDGEEYVRTNPRESLVMALAAGFVAGILLVRQ
ncbi:MAG: CsbD family protein [Chthoniobacteraceae bacterium]